MVLDLSLKEQGDFLYNELTDEGFQVERVVTQFTRAILAEVGHGFEERID